MCVRSVYVPVMKRVMLSDLVLPLSFQKCTVLQEHNRKKYFIFDLGIPLSASFRHVIDNGAVLCDLCSNLAINFINNM